MWAGCTSVAVWMNCQILRVARTTQQGKSTDAISAWTEHPSEGPGAVLNPGGGDV
jgi:fatty acid-binding protein DegV